MAEKDKRRAPRQKVFKGARISFSHLGTSVECTVRNLSVSGALLTVENQLGIPDEFDLLMPDQPIRHCRVAWRRGNRIGVEFHP